MKDVLERVLGVSSNGLGHPEGMEFNEACQGIFARSAGCFAAVTSDQWPVTGGRGKGIIYELE
jgi:hypothetical protein